MLQRRLHVPALFLQGCRRFLSATNGVVMLQRRLHVPALFLQGCMKIPFQQQIMIAQRRLHVPAFIPSRAVEDSFQQQIIMLQGRLHIPALFLQGCRRFLSTTNNNASETTSCSSFIPSKAVEDSFQATVIFTSERLHVPALFLQGCEDSFP
ncbi:unnamed protein product [Acanthosepion pharaonis]|uniref:Uncharacterized protein n=1 Tax=Acanthosepion pharaonis TaxID=158019 RepID=A0A812BXI1_ACAPH|nr:unnamed protein product [Sepia pharaonis]